MFKQKSNPVSIGQRCEWGACYFDERKDTKMVINVLNSKMNRLEVIFIDDAGIDEFKCQSNFIVHLNDLKELNKRHDGSRITSSNKYLVLWKENIIIYIDLFKNNSIVSEIRLSNQVFAAAVLPNTDDLIVMCKVYSVILIRLNANKLETQILVDPCNGSEMRWNGIILEKEYLIVRSNERTLFYNLHDLANKKETHPLNLNKKIISNLCCISIESKFCIFLSSDYELSVYDLKDNMRQIASLQIAKEIFSLQSSEKYFSAMGYNKDIIFTEKLLTFEIISD